MYDETAEIELVSTNYNHLLLNIDKKLSVTTKPEQNTTIIEADDQYEFYGQLLKFLRNSSDPDVLDSFEARVEKLEKSILPLYTATKILNRRKSSE